MDAKVERKSEEVEAEVEGVNLEHHKDWKLGQNTSGRGKKLYGYNISIF